MRIGSRPSSASRRAAALDATEATEPLELLRTDRRMDRRGELAALEPLHPLEVGVARRARVEDESAADRRVRAQDDAVAARRDDGLGEPQLGVALADPGHASHGLARAVVHLDAEWDLGDRLEHH